MDHALGGTVGRLMSTAEGLPEPHHHKASRGLSLPQHSGAQPQHPSPQESSEVLALALNKQG